MNLDTRVRESPSPPTSESRKALTPTLGERLIQRVKSLGWPLLVTGIFFAIWQGIYLLGIFSPIIFPSPITVVGQIFFVAGNMLTGGYMLPEYLITLREVVLGFLLAVVFGITIGGIVGVTEIGRKGVMPLVVGLQTMPKVAFAPVFIAWFGFGMTPKILLATIVALFPVIVNTASGLMTPSHHELKLFRQMRASRWQTLWKLQFPAALPSIFAGLRTASVFAVIGAVIGEFIGGGAGFGELIRVGADMLRIDRVFGLIFWLSLSGLLLYSIVAIIERRVVYWRDSPVKAPTP